MNGMAMNGVLVGRSRTSLCRGWRAADFADNVAGFGRTLDAWTATATRPVRA